MTSENGVLQGEFLHICKMPSLGKIFLCKNASDDFVYFQICCSSLSLPTFEALVVSQKNVIFGVKQASKVGQFCHEHLFQTAVDQSQIEISSKVRYHMKDQGIAYLTIYINKFFNLYPDLQSLPKLTLICRRKFLFANISVNIDPRGLKI